MSKEKIYSTMSSSGVMALAAGIVVIAVGVAAGVLMIISGARLIAGKKDVTL